MDENLDSFQLRALQIKTMLRRINLTWDHEYSETRSQRSPLWPANLN